LITIAFLITVEWPWLNNDRTVPDLPHLIVVPGTLMAQWEHELKVFFQPKKVDILKYTGGPLQHEQFWDPVCGPFSMSKHDDHHKIILATHSVRKLTLHLSLAHCSVGTASRLQDMLHAQK
jgi:hypothetical protein